MEFLKAITGSTGNTDTPVEKTGDADALGMGHFATALAHFLSHCGTPLTVGIQGEWGSGKTSLMNMVKSELAEPSGREEDPPFLFHTFETWQYGSLGDDRTLGLQLLTNLVDTVLAQLEEASYVSRKGRRLKSNMMNLLGTAAGVAVNTATGGAIDGAGTAAAVDSLTGAGGGQTIQEIREDFADIVAEASQNIKEERGSDQAGRLVIFVDDLDRIRPARAVALLEVLKNFMEVPNCVFVLACDYDVIRRGVRDKFGITSEEKARAFFDKIIQVPFQMPVGQYELDRLLEDFLFERLHKTKNNGFGGNEAKDVAFELAEELAPLVQLATGTNPRSFKRYLNILDLLTCVEYARGDGTTPWTKRSKIFCRTLLVALQVGWEDVANYLDTCESHDEYVKVLQTLRGFDANNVLDFKKQEDEDIDAGLVELLEAEYAPSAGKTEPDKWLANPAIERLGTFGSELFDLLDENHDGDLDESELDTFITVTEELSLTSVNRNQKLTGWHKFRHNLRENSSGDRRTRTGTARRYRRLARKLYDKRKPGVVSIGRFDNRFTVKLQFNGQRTVVELKDEFVIKIRERNDPASDGSLDIPASYSDLVAEFVERSTMEADLPWNRTSWSNTQYWELNFDDLKPTKKQYKCLEEGLTDLVHRGTKIAQKLTTQQQPNAKSAVVEGVGATASS